jgi:photosystem II stability/assembly factor-like uncharacterized protein
VSDSAIVPERPATLYAATDVGVFVTEDRGRTWDKFESATAPLAASVVAVDPVDRRKIIASYSDRIWQTSDRGTSWRETSFFFDVVDFTSLAIDPTDDQVLYAGTSWYFAEGALWMSDDGGDSWEQTPGVPAGIPAIVVGTDARAHVSTAQSGVFDG